jgi:polygalacturonase
MGPAETAKPKPPAVSIRDFGAKSWKWTDNAPSIQSCIDFIHHKGGGIVIIPSGLFMSSTIELKSNVELRLQKGATLLGRPFLDDYPEIIPRPRNLLDTSTPRSLIYAFAAENIALTGQGSIHANGLILGMQSDDVKPLGLRFVQCRKVKVEGVTLKYAASWMQLYQHCEGVQVKEVTVYNHGNGRCDGLDIDGSSDVLVEGCDIDAYDDAVAVKSSGERPARNILVRTCTLRSMKRAIKIGTESLTGFKNISFEDITIERSRRRLANLFPHDARLGILAGIADGASVSGLSFRGIEMSGVESPFAFIQSNMDRRLKKGGTMTAPRRIETILLENIRAEASTASPSVISGLPGQPMHGIVLRDIDIASPGTTKGAPSARAEPNIDGKPRHHMYGEHLPASGLYVQHAEELAIDDFCIELDSEDPRPPIVLMSPEGGVVSHGEARSGRQCLSIMRQP